MFPTFYDFSLNYTFIQDISKINVGKLDTLILSHTHATRALETLISANLNADTPICERLTVMSRIRMELGSLVKTLTGPVSSCAV